MTTASTPSQAVSSDSRPDLDYVVSRYESSIRFYWRASKANKRWYKSSRFATIILSAVVTLIASLSLAKFLAASTCWSVTFALATPLLAALLTIVTGFSQTFQWGAAWRDMVLNAERLASELDRIRVTPTERRDPIAELKTLNDVILDESSDFFQRIVGGANPVNSDAEHLPQSPST